MSEGSQHDYVEEFAPPTIGLEFGDHFETDHRHYASVTSGSEITWVLQAAAYNCPKANGGHPPVSRASYSTSAGLGLCDTCPGAPSGHGSIHSPVSVDNLGGGTGRGGGSKLNPASGETFSYYTIPNGRCQQSGEPGLCDGGWSRFIFYGAENDLAYALPCRIAFQQQEGLDCFSTIAGWLDLVTTMGQIRVYRTSDLFQHPWYMFSSQDRLSVASEAVGIFAGFLSMIHMGLVQTCLTGSPVSPGSAPDDVDRKPSVLFDKAIPFYTGMRLPEGWTVVDLGDPCTWWSTPLTHVGEGTRWPG